MREPVRSEPMRATTLLIIANVACFIVFNIFLEISAPGKGALRDQLYLSLAGLKEGRIWQLLSFQFLHANLLHLLFNMMGMYFIGRIVEDRLPRARFFQLYLVSGVLGGLAQVLAGLVLSKFGGPVVGASAGVTALLAAFSLMYWHQRFKVLLFFFIPVELTGQFMFWAVLASSVIGLVLTGASVNNEPGIAHIAHLGGFFSAFLFVSRDGSPARFGEWIASQTARRPKKTMVSAGKAATSWGAAAPVQEEELPADEFISKEVDPILDKISAQGLHSLTERERKILDKARSKMAKR